MPKSTKKSGDQDSVNPKNSSKKKLSFAEKILRQQTVNNKIKAKPETKYKTKHKTKLNPKAKQAITLIVVILLIFISVGFNIAQIFIHDNLTNEANDIAWRLNNYRDLQDKQIQAAKEYCRRLNEISIDPLGYYQGVLKDYDESLAQQYRTNINLRCIVPALLIYGGDISTKEEYDDYIDKTFVENSFVIKDEAFEEVRW